jgi:5-amino-6-(5-phosphoribosylamino)uracil reductase
MDGKIATSDRRPFSLGTKHDHLMMDYLRAHADVVLMGANTIRAHQRFIRVKGKRNIAIRKKLGLATQPANAIITSALDLDPDMAFFKSNNDKRIIFYTGRPKNSKIKQLERRCELIQIPRGQHTAQKIADELSKRQLNRILHEGGGGSLFEFVKADLIDEWNITLTPKIVGGANSPTLVDGPGFSIKQIKSYRLCKVTRVNNELYLKYKRP